MYYMLLSNTTTFVICSVCSLLVSSTGTCHLKSALQMQSSVLHIIMYSILVRLQVTAECGELNSIADFFFYSVVGIMKWRTVSWAIALFTFFYVAYSTQHWLFRYPPHWYKFVFVKHCIDSG
jgi:hypothetical protein